MNQKTLTLWLLGALLAVSLFVAHSLAQAAPEAAGSAPTRIAVIDFVRVFNECAQIKDLNEFFRQKQDELETEGRQRQKVIEGKRIELSAFQPGSVDYERIRKDFLRLGTEANVWLKMSEQDLESRRFDWTRVIYQNALDAAERIAAEQNFDVILQYKPFNADDIEPTLVAIRRIISTRSVVFRRGEIEITAEVIRRLDTTYKAGGGKKQLIPNGP